MRATIGLTLLAVLAVLPTGCGTKDSARPQDSQGVPPPKTEATEEESLQGTWAAIALIENGREEPDNDVKEVKLTIEGDNYILWVDEDRTASASNIDQTQNPKEMDITFEEGPQKGRTLLAIYSLEGDVLRICGGDRRPAEFTSKPNSEVALMVFRRQ